MLAVEENPPMLSPTAKSLVEISGPWRIAHTKSRAEKAFCWDLVRLQLDFFLPMLERITFSGGRRRHVLCPMFPSYVFFSGSDGDRYEALTTNRLCQILEVKDQQKLVDELIWIETALRGKAVLDAYPHAVVGRRCRVRSGPLMGVEGIVVERSKLTRLALQVSMLGQGASLQIHPDLLEPLD